jgi:hypothetical protein
MKPMLTAAMTLLVAVATAAEQEIVAVELPPLPDFNMFEHIRNIPKPERVFCRSAAATECPAADRIRVLGSISDSDVKAILPLAEKKRTRAAQITGDARAAELVASIGDIGFEHFICYRVKNEWKCTSLWSAPH